MNVSGISMCVCLISKIFTNCVEGEAEVKE